MEKKQKDQVVKKVAHVLAKSMYKAVAKALHDRGEAKEVVDDILDPNYTAEVDPDKVPSKRKINIMNKTDEDKCLKFNKGIDVLKLFLNKKKAK